MEEVIEMVDRKDVKENNTNDGRLSTAQNIKDDELPSDEPTEWKSVFIKSRSLSEKENMKELVTNTDEYPPTDCTGAETGISGNVVLDDSNLSAVFGMNRRELLKTPQPKLTREVLWRQQSSDIP